MTTQGKKELDIKFTRQDYMSGKITHNDYYGQFVTWAIYKLVRDTFENEILLSKDPYFNDIPLARWDRLASCLDVYHKHVLKAMANVDPGGISIADRICLLKCAAAMIRDGNGPDQPSIRNFETKIAEQNVSVINKSLREDVYKSFDFKTYINPKSGDWCYYIYCPKDSDICGDYFSTREKAIEEVHHQVDRLIARKKKAIERLNGKR